MQTCGSGCKEIWATMKSFVEEVATTTGGSLIISEENMALGLNTNIVSPDRVLDHIYERRQVATSGA